MTVCTPFGTINSNDILLYRREKVLLIMGEFVVGKM